VKLLDNMLMNQEMSPEMFIAVAQLRNEYDDKFLGFLGLGQDVAKDLTVDLIKESIGKANPLFTLVDGIMDVAEGLGAINKQDAIHKSAPIICYLPTAVDAYKDAILRVKQGDTSDEALELVNMNYIFVRESLKTLCDYMAVAGTAQQKEEYKELAEKLENLEIGHSLGGTESELEAMEYDLFFKSRVDPDGRRYYA